MTTIEKLVLFLESSGFKIAKYTDDTIFFKQCTNRAAQSTEIDNLRLMLEGAGLKRFSIQSSVLTTMMINPDGRDHFDMFTYSLTDFEDFAHLNVFKFSIELTYYVVGGEVSENPPSTQAEMMDLIRKKGGFEKIFYDWCLVDYLYTAPMSGVVEKL